MSFLNFLLINFLLFPLIPFNQIVSWSLDFLRNLIDYRFVSAFLLFFTLLHSLHIYYHSTLFATILSCNMVNRSSLNSRIQFIKVIIRHKIFRVLVYSRLYLRFKEVVFSFLAQLQLLKFSLIKKPVFSFYPAFEAFWRKLILFLQILRCATWIFKLFVLKSCLLEFFSYF